MPRSGGGGYQSISRGLGTLPGTVVGLSLWLGLVYASVFHLVGFGHYATAVLAEVGVTLGVSPVTPLALLFAVALTGLSVTGTENATKLQNVVVALLLGILTLFLTYGGLDALGVFGRPSVPQTFFRFGYPPVLTTAALVFTSFGVRASGDGRRRDQASWTESPASDGWVGPLGGGVLRRNDFRGDQRLRK